MKIGFYLDTFCFRGTTRAAIDYCYMLTGIHDVSILFNKHSSGNKLSLAVQLLRDGIYVEGVAREDVDAINSFGFEWLYIVTSRPDRGNLWLCSLNCKTLLHQVGYEPKTLDIATVYAYTSHWQNSFLDGGKSRVLPYSICSGGNAEIDYRSMLGIPRQALVLGRHGGQDTWNLRFINDVLRDCISSREDLHLVFMNTPKFIYHPRVHYLEASIKATHINSFIMACDAMIHARWEGETFGMACAEFLIRGKPILTWSESRERNHILLSGRSCIFYNLPEDAMVTVKSLTKDFLAYKASLIPVDHLEFYSSTNVSKVLRNLLGC